MGGAEGHSVSSSSNPHMDSKNRELQCSDKLCIFPSDWMQPPPLKSVERFALVTFWSLLIGLEFFFFFERIVQIGH